MNKKNTIGLKFPLIFLLIFSIVYHPSIQELFLKFDRRIDLLLVSPQMFFLLASAFIIVQKKISKDYVGLTFKNWKKYIGMGILVGFIPYVLLFLANLIAGHTHHEMPDVSENIQWDLWTGISMLVLAPISEEIFFRGIILHSLMENFSVKVAIIASSLLFMASHSPMMLGPFLLGIIGASMTIKTRSLIPAMIFHAMSNGLPLYFINHCPNLQAFQNWIFMKL